MMCVGCCGGCRCCSRRGFDFRRWRGRDHRMNAQKSSRHTNLKTRTHSHQDEVGSVDTYCSCATPEDALFCRSYQYLSNRLHRNYSENPCSCCLPTYLKNRPTIFPARPRAMLLPVNALPAQPLAWLNLSHREKAIVFVIVRTSAITAK